MRSRLNSKFRSRALALLLHFRKQVLYYSLWILSFRSLHNAHKFLDFDQWDEGVALPQPGSFRAAVVSSTECAIAVWKSVILI